MDKEIPEDRKRELRRMRAGTHWSSDKAPDFYKRTPEYLRCIEDGKHFDTLIGYVAQGGGVLNGFTAAEQEHINERNRETHVPSYTELWQQGFAVFKSGKGKQYVRGRELAWENHVASNALGQLPCNHVTDDMAQLYFDSLSLGEDGRKKLLQIFRWLSKRAIKAGHLHHCPFDEVKIRKQRTTEDKGPKYFHPATEYPLILEHARDDDAREYFGFSMGAGPRPAEAKHFDWADVEMQTRKLTFRFGGSEDGATKGGKPVTVPMTAEAHQWLQRRIDRKHDGIKPERGIIFAKRSGKPYGRNYDFGLKETLELAGIEAEARRLYAFRHGFCVALANEFFGDHWTRAEARLMMRHSNPATTDVYYHVLEHELANKAAQSKPLTNPDDFDDFGGGSDGGGTSQAIQISPIKKGANPARIAPFGSSLASQRALLVAWLCVRVYVAYTTTASVWISSARLDGRLIQPC